MTSLSDHFLIAMPTLKDPNFFHGVTYLCEHNDEGAMGIMINRPLDIDLAEVLGQMNIANEQPNIGNKTILLGGPVQCERGFVVHKPHGDWESTLEINENIGITSSRDILEALARGEGPQECLIALG